MSQNKKLMRHATFAIAEVTEVAICAENAFSLPLINTNFGSILFD